MIDIDELKKCIQLTKSGNFDIVEKTYEKWLSENPDDFLFLSVAGLFFVEIKKYDKAAEILQKAYCLNKTLGTVSALGVAEYLMGNYTSAAEHLLEALEYGNTPEIYTKLISCFYEMKKLKSAIEYADKMFELYPENVVAVANKVKALSHSGKLSEAEKLCTEYLREHTDSGTMWYQLGYLKELIYCDDRQARQCFEAALDLGSKEALYDIGVSCHKLGEKDEAEKYYKKMLEIFPDDISTKTSLGMLYLSQKKFKEGYEYFYDRKASDVSKYTTNLWSPGKEIEREIVIICEQGFGDHIQFIRYIPFLENRKIKIAVPKSLRKLFHSNYPNLEYIEYSDIPKDVQALRITNLAYALNMDFNNIPYSEGYLNEETKEIFSNKLKVGLCWEAGSAGIRTMINRTIHIKCFEPILNLDFAQFYSFQYEDTFKGNEKYADRMINLAKDFNDFSDTAQSLKAMDVVITVDTSVAHLAGALGVKTFLLLPYAADWRWFDDTKETPWYKSIRIFKQVDPISWEVPFNNIIEELKNLI